MRTTKNNKRCAHQREPMTAVIYNRVAVSESMERLKQYQNICRHYAQQKNWTVVGEFSDIGSGLSSNRPGLIKMKQLMVRVRIDAVITYDFTRLSRSMVQMRQLCQEVEARGAHLYCARLERAKICS